MLISNESKSLDTGLNIINSSHKKIRRKLQKETVYEVGVRVLSLLGTCISTSLTHLWNKVFGSKHVRFAGARARVFTKNSPAKNVEYLNSFEFKGSKKQGTPQTRKIPPMSFCDTIIAKSDQTQQSAHGTMILFDEDEIVEKRNILKKVKIGTRPDFISFYSGSSSIPIFAYYTDHGKAIIQQQATRGCTAAVIAMLVMDHGRKPDIEALHTTNLGTDETQASALKKAGLSAITTSVRDLSELRALIAKNGSAVVSGRGHVIVVDDIAKDLSTVRLRDPYHGWEITVTQKAFLEGWDKSPVMQAKRLLPNFLPF